MPEWTLRISGGPAVPCTVERDGDAWVVRVGGRAYRLGVTVLEPGRALVETDAGSLPVRSAAAGGRLYLNVDGATLACEMAPGAAGSAAAGGARDEQDLRAPMPGVVAQVAVAVGDAVRPGQALVVVEAMKMEHVIRAARAGVVRALHVRAGEQVEAGTAVVEVAPAEAGAEP